MCTTNISAVMWEKFHLVGANSTTTSYYNNNPGELETITTYVARLGKQLQVPTPVFDKAYTRLTSL